VGALDGIRVLDLSWGIAGPLGVLLLAEQGADVVKVEPPGGDPFRAYAGSHVWNRSRRSVEVDLRGDAGREAFLRLVATADVVVETFRPDVLDRLGVGWPVLRARNDRVVLCSVPAYPDGHRLARRPGWDALVQAASGQQFDQPGWRMGPIFLHMPMPSMGAMFLVPSGILAALLARERTGRGQHVRTSLLQGAFLYTTQIWQDIERASAAEHEMMGKTYPMGIHQPMIYRTADGWVHCSVLSGGRPSRTVDEVVGVDAVDGAPSRSGFGPDGAQPAALDPATRDAVAELRRVAFARWNTAELVAALREAGHAVEPVVSMEAALAEPHAQLAANGMVATVDDPVLGRTTQIGVPIHLATTPGAIRGPRPTPGQHAAEIWAEVGYGPADIPAITGAAR
jgi:crotonobetainyl-CoA:carnitine CoA-transferase CaiB-like acyl-CoA transferase